jgi:hypothetical protein
VVSVVMRWPPPSTMIDWVTLSRGSLPFNVSVIEQCLK